MEITLGPHALRNPYHIEHLPLLARLYRNGFRSGRSDMSGVARFLARIAFYVAHRTHLCPARGRLDVTVGGESRLAHFDARNRQFNSLYFERYAHAYEPEIMGLVEALIPDDGVFYDVGSNWGYFAVYVASRPNFRGKVWAFEPWPSSYRDLAGLVDELRLDDRIACQPFALGASNSAATMQCAGHSGLARLVDSGVGTAITVRRLDDLEFPPPSAIKIDAEGHESAIFRGGQRLLAKHRPFLIFEHRTSPLDQQIDMREPGLQFLESLGYRLFAPTFRFVDSQKKSPRYELNLQELSPSRRTSPTCDNLLACHGSRIDTLVAAGKRRAA